jgi:hypothetical protein
MVLFFVNHCLHSGGFHSSGPLSPFAWLTLSVTASSCGLVRSLAKPWRRAVVQAAAPDYSTSVPDAISIHVKVKLTFHALLNGTK